MSRKLLLVDSAQHVFRRQNQGGLESYCRKLIKSVLAKPFPYVAVALESPEGTNWRTKILPSYKGSESRIFSNPSIKHQYEQMEHLTKALGITCLKQPGFEGDDIIATMVAKSKKHNDFETYIYSNDKDFYQCLTVPRANMILTLATGGYYIIQAMHLEKKYGIPLSRFVDYLSVVGDHCRRQNIFGIRNRIGRKLFTDYPNIEEVMKASIPRSQFAMMIAVALAQKGSTLTESDIQSLAEKITPPAPYPISPLDEFDDEAEAEVDDDADNETENPDEPKGKNNKRLTPSSSPSSCSNAIPTSKKEMLSANSPSSSRCYSIPFPLDVPPSSIDIVKSFIADPTVYIQTGPLLPLSYRDKRKYKNQKGSYQPVSIGHQILLAKTFSQSGCFEHPDTADRIVANFNHIRLRKKLLTLDDQVPNLPDVEDTKFDVFNVERAAPLLKAFGLEKLINRFKVANHKIEQRKNLRHHFKKKTGKAAFRKPTTTQNQVAATSQATT